MVPTHSPQIGRTLVNPFWWPHAACAAHGSQNPSRRYADLTRSHVRSCSRVSAVIGSPSKIEGLHVHIPTGSYRVPYGVRQPSGSTCRELTPSRALRCHPGASLAEAYENLLRFKRQRKPPASHH